MRNLILAFLSAFLCVGLLSGCTDDSDKLIPKPIFKKKEEKLDLGDFTKVVSTNKVDILFVIDSSGSMSSHQATLSSNIGLFVNGIMNAPNIDYHIGVTDSDMDLVRGRLKGVPNFVTDQTPAGIQVLQTNLIVGTSGSGTESFFEPLVYALSEPNLSGANKDFYRDEAFLAVVFITDAEDQSSAYDASMAVEFLRTLKGNLNKVLVYGVYIPPAMVSNPLCASDDGNNPARKLEEFFNLTAAKTFWLCDPAYGTKLAEIGQDLYNNVSRRIPLDQVPSLRTISLRFGTQIVPNDPKKGWTYEAKTNSLVLGMEMQLKEEPPGTTFEVQFVPADLE